MQHEPCRLQWRLRPHLEGWTCCWPSGPQVSHSRLPYFSVRYVWGVCFERALTALLEVGRIYELRIGDNAINTSNRLIKASLEYRHTCIVRGLICPDMAIQVGLEQQTLRTELIWHSRNNIWARFVGCVGRLIWELNPYPIASEVKDKHGGWCWRDRSSSKKGRAIEYDEECTTIKGINSLC